MGVADSISESAKYISHDSESLFTAMPKTRNKWSKINQLLLLMLLEVQRRTYRKKNIFSFLLHPLEGEFNVILTKTMYFFHLLN